jgi:GWxTD domain-containing protein
MTAFLPFSQSTLLHALGWSLLHSFWQGAAVALLLACVLWLFRDRSPQLRYVVCSCALALMVLLPGVTFLRLASIPQASVAASVSPTVVTTINSGGLNTQAEPWLHRLAASLDHMLPWILAVWLIGVLLFLMRFSVGLVGAQKMKAAAASPVPQELLPLFQTLKERLGIVRAVKLIHSAGVQVPTVIGWLRPAVLIPIGCLSGLSTLQIEAIFAHELAHIRRCDYLLSIVQAIVEALLFYHPAIWWISGQMRKEREHCCDDLAVILTGDSLAYAKALAFLEEHRSPTPTLALGANGGILTMRIRRLLEQKETPAVSRVAVLTLLSLAVAAAGVYLGAARAQSNPEQPQIVEDNGALQGLPLPYQQWLTQDVLWIITPQERATFITLPNNDERDKFIEQFWERRNTTPEVPGNTTKAEHYRRIAYANQHFATTIPGWKTDRGHIYIVYGPPSSIDSHPSGGKDDGKFISNPFEYWHYQQYHLLLTKMTPDPDHPGEQRVNPVQQDVDFEFIDTCNCGDYRLQPFPLPKP